MKNILAVIPARGGSKGIPRKNIVKINDRPLIDYTIQAALQVSRINDVVVSTEDKEISTISKELGAQVPFIRSDHLATNQMQSAPVIIDALNQMERLKSIKYDAVLMLQPTSPLRTSKHIDDALKIFLKSDSDSLVSVTEVPHNMNPYSIMQLKKDGTIKPFLKYDENNNLRQKKPIFYARNGAAIYICTYQCLMKKNSLYGDKIVPFFMNKETSIDLDDEIDWKIAQYFM